MADKGFTNMQLPKKPKVELGVPEVYGSEVDNRPRYPYGLEVQLENDSLTKLGYSSSDFTVGGTVNISAICTVETVQSSERINQNPSESVELQITDFRIDSVAGKGVTRKAALSVAKKAA